MMHGQKNINYAHSCSVIDISVPYMCCYMKIWR